jgi:hypothetical protein
MKGMKNMKEKIKSISLAELAKYAEVDQDQKLINNEGHEEHEGKDKKPLSLGGTETQQKDF